MSRTPQLPDRSEIAADEVEYYDTVAARRQHQQLPINPYNGVLLNSPPFAAALATMSRLTLQLPERGGTFSHLQRDFINVVLCNDWDTTVVLDRHIPFAAVIGVRLEAIEAIRQGKEDELTKDERHLVAYIHRVANGNVTDESWNTMRQAMGERGAIEFTITIAYLMLVIRLYQAFDVPSSSGQARLSEEDVDAMIRDFKDGRTELPSLARYMEHVGL